MDRDEMTVAEERAWARLIALTELLPGALDAQLQRDHELSHFEYMILLMLDRAPGRVLRMTALAAQTNAALPRLSHAMRRLEDRSLVSRFPCPEDRRATNATIADAGLGMLNSAAPGHFALARRLVLDVLSPEQLDQVYSIAGQLLESLDPDGRMTATSCHPSMLPVSA